MLWTILLACLAVIGLLNAAFSWLVMRMFPDLYKWSGLVEWLGLRRAIVVRSVVYGVVGIAASVALYLRLI
jgi:hypothetical protein